MESNPSTLRRLIVRFIVVTMNKSQKEALKRNLIARSGGNVTPDPVTFRHRGTSLPSNDMPNKKEAWRKIQQNVAKIPGMPPLPDLQHEEWIPVKQNRFRRLLQFFKNPFSRI